ncbi:PREDICTED: uncharacterized protein LOC104803611 [Tarenaya hassleriana]|uniref:uncharacterized protein LOC104803611 n=1 Tax=Tarenaya hassleriana TaxID=28532 RepID=UPI00053C9276|nr:PREDICTED: uncharacterized protein LOC104803611 [Tarenaya hassleriana]
MGQMLVPITFCFLTELYSRSYDTRATDHSTRLHCRSSREYVPYVVENGCGKLPKSPEEMAKIVADWFRPKSEELKIMSRDALRLSRPEAVFKIFTSSSDKEIVFSNSLVLPNSLIFLFQFPSLGKSNELSQLFSSFGFCFFRVILVQSNVKFMFCYYNIAQNI